MPSRDKGKAVAARQGGGSANVDTLNTVAGLIVATQLSEEPSPLMPSSFPSSVEMATPRKLAARIVPSNRKNVESTNFSHDEMAAIIIKYVGVINPMLMLKSLLVTDGNAEAESSKATLMYAEGGLMVRKTRAFKLFGGSQIVKVKVEDDLKSRRAYFRDNHYTFKDDLYPWLESIGLTPQDYLTTPELFAMAMEEVGMESVEPVTDMVSPGGTPDTQVSASRSSPRSTNSSSPKRSPTASVNASASIGRVPTAASSGDSVNVKNS
jgi:hypothetical protein